MNRATGTVLAVALLALLIPEAVAGDCDDLKQLEDWQRCLSEPHLAGDKAHKEFLVGLETALRNVKGNMPITVDSQERSFTRWESGHPTIKEEGQSPLEGQIWPLPYSGLTDKAGVSAELYYEGCIGLKWHFDAKKHAGKIVVLEIKPSIGLKLLLMLATQRALPTWAQLSPGEYRRAISFEKQIPSLQEAQLMGVRGLIVVVDADPAIARDQYVPFLRALHDVPAVYVDCKLGKDVIELARKHRTVTLQHYGRLYPNTTTRHLLVTLPAIAPTPAPPDCSLHDGAIVISTHTDGTNWFEDNGPYGLWWLLDSFKNETCRPRDLVFVFAAAHFAHEPGSNDDVVRKNPVLFARTRAAVVIEHLGALRYTKNEKETKTPEPMVVLTTEHDKGLNRLAKQMVKAHESLRPVHILWPGNLKFGEGVHLEEAGIPTIGFLSNPAYLLQLNPDNQLQWFKKDLMDAQLVMLRELVKGMMGIERPDR